MLLKTITMNISDKKYLNNNIYFCSIGCIYEFSELLTYF